VLLSKPHQTRLLAVVIFPQPYSLFYPFLRPPLSLIIFFKWSEFPTFERGPGRISQEKCMSSREKEKSLFRREKAGKTN